MSEPQTGNASPNSRKRSLPEEDLGVPSTPSVLSVDRSPLLSRNAGSQENPYDLSGNDSVPGERHDSAGSTNNDAVPTKRRKLTVQEKEEKKREKEEKERQRAEQRAKRDEEKQLKGEERRKKNEEKEEKQRQKDLEKQQKEEALRKKERSQMRLASFFTKPATPQSSRPSLARSEPSAPDVKGKSVSFVAIDNPQGSPPRTVSPHKKFFSEYELFFLPFELPSNVTCAPVNAFIRDDEEIQTKRRKLDHHIEEPLEESSLSIRFHVPQEQRQLRGERTPPVRQIMECLHGTSANPIDLTQDASTNRNRTPMDELLCIPMKYLHFGEDVRPPYYGTYTKIQSRHEGRRLARNPFSRTLPEADYSYDSEAEWEEPEEGEDLDSEDDEDVESVGSAEDMQGFLDDEDAVEAAKSRRGHIAGSLEPVCSGLHWEDAEGVLRPADPSATSVNFTGFRMGTLLGKDMIILDEHARL
ncbi:hypothetical protein H2199_006324 [Coniosporium tulheliwenetii]|uniref:Uncharacterized protein n=1 Tax=Coniosporium tulheliwenetii TaxID=3383036 RepID=A0ACC2YXJ3_9PEZI|nr:hypothetical protein H2199_006324 [Cladosporium sp. JES 115]